MTKKTVKFEYFQGPTDGLWYWHLTAANGDKIADGGEGYESKAGVLKGIARVKKLAPTARKVDCSEKKP